MQDIVVRPDSTRAKSMLQGYFCETTGLPAATVTETLERYEEAGRHYHSLRHLATIVATAKAHGICLSPAQALAVLFHDAIYQVGSPRGQNELQSAELLKTVAAGYVDEAVIVIASQIVLDTAIHYPSQDASFVVLDLDLIGLADTIENVRDDGKLVSLEYRDCVEGWDHFATARAAFFREMLGRHRILWSPELSAYETRLRANLAEVVANPAPRSARV
jgi:predicted metal-dependent HD superfamily phosphohydrolase